MSVGTGSETRGIVLAERLPA